MNVGTVILDASHAPIFPHALTLARDHCEEVYRSVCRINESLQFHIKVIVDGDDFEKYHGKGTEPKLPAFLFVAEIVRKPIYRTTFTIVGRNAEQLTKTHVNCIHYAWYFYTACDLRRMHFPYIAQVTPSYAREVVEDTPTQEAQVVNHLYIPDLAHMPHFVIPREHTHPRSTPLPTNNDHATHMDIDDDVDMAYFNVGWAPSANDDGFTTPPPSPQSSPLPSPVDDLLCYETLPRFTDNPRIQQPPPPKAHPASSALVSDPYLFLADFDTKLIT